MAEAVVRGWACDADGLLRLYRDHGFVGALQRLRGDFAVAVRDGDTLWLGRDRLGVCPLYYSPSRGSFGRRPRDLGVPLRPRRQFVALFAASHYRTFDHDPALSAYEEIAQVPAGCAVEWRGGRVRATRYWTLTEEPEWDRPEEDLAREYAARLMDAVSIRLKTAQRPVFTVSGGMDSSSVLACAVKLLGRRLPATSAVYDDATFDESADIRDILDPCVDPWAPVRVGNPDVLGLLKEMVDANDEPVATATWLSHYLICREAARRGHDVLFGGLGGDELNAGEYEYFFFHFADLRAAGDEPRLAREIERWVAYHDHPVYRKSRAVAEEALDRLADPARPGVCMPDRTRIRRYARALNPDYFRIDDFEPLMETVFRSCLKNRAWQDLTRETMPCCLRAGDRHAAAFGLSQVQPFLDHELVEFMFRVPGTMKIRDGVTKHLLRLAMKGVLPEATRTRVKKTGWNAPAHVWFTGAGAASLRDLIRSRSFRERGIYDTAEVERLLDEHERILASVEPRENHMMFLWQVANLETWLRNLEP